MSLKLLIDGPQIFHLWANPINENKHENFWINFLKKLRVNTFDRNSIKLSQPQMKLLLHDVDLFLDNEVDIYKSLTREGNITHPFFYRGVKIDLNNFEFPEDLLTEKYLTLHDCLNEAIQQNSFIIIYNISTLGPYEMDLLKRISINTLDKNETHDVLNNLIRDGYITTNDSGFSITDKARKALFLTSKE